MAWSMNLAYTKNHGDRVKSEKNQTKPPAQQFYHPGQLLAGMLQKADEDLEDIGIFLNFANFTELYLRAPDEFDNNFWFFEKISISTFDL